LNNAKDLDILYSKGVGAERQGGTRSFPHFIWQKLEKAEYAAWKRRGERSFCEA
jgi:hypothetical protein